MTKFLLKRRFFRGFVQIAVPAVVAAALMLMVTRSQSGTWSNTAKAALVAWMGLYVVWATWHGLQIAKGLIVMSRDERRLAKHRCSKCEYPLRFNGSEFWCSECGYKHFLRIDPPLPDHSPSKQLQRDE